MASILYGEEMIRYYILLILLVLNLNIGCSKSPEIDLVFDEFLDINLGKYGRPDVLYYEKGTFMGIGKNE